MITGEVKNKVDRLWEMFWTGGLTNPLDVIEQITYLMFIRDLDSQDRVHAKDFAKIKQSHTSVFPQDREELRWSVFHDKPAEEMYRIIQIEVFPFIKGLHGDAGSTYSKYMGDAIFKVPTPQLLDKIVTALDELYTLIDASKDRKDAKGDLYEYLLSKLSTAGTNGQFRTPRHIIRMMVELLDLRPEDTICDPACGTAGFLVAAGEYLEETFKDIIFQNPATLDHYHNAMFTGYDMDRTMLRIGAMNMMTHGIANPDIQYKDSLSDQNSDTNTYTAVLANPPFKGSLDHDIVAADLTRVTKTKKTELLFLALFLRILKTRGRCACIVPDGVLFGSSNAHRAIRQELVEKHILNAVISMPSGVFKPYAGVSTAVLVFTKSGSGGTDKVWFYDMESDGYSLDDKRTKLESSDIPDIVSRYKNLTAEADRKRTDKSFLVPKDEIAANGYDLSINKYKESNYVEETYPQPLEIMKDIQELEGEITRGLAELEEMLRG